MKKFTYEEPKAVAAALFVINTLETVGKHMLAKILFFADQKHLARYGRPITLDTYYKLPKGPVPTIIYDEIKAVEKKKSAPVINGFHDKISVSGNNITALIEPDMDELSETDVECLLESITENKGLTFDQLTRKSHGSAWSSASECGPIHFNEIAKEGKAPDYILELLNMNLEAEHLLRV